MNTVKTVDLDTLLQEQEAAETNFEAEISTLSDDEKAAKRVERKKANLKAQLDLKEDLAKTKEIADNQKKRAEKAEGKKDDEPKALQLSYKDSMALSQANVSIEDVDEVIEYAAFKKIPIIDALNSSVIKESLKQKAEARKAAEAANTQRSRSTTSTPTGETLLENARKDIMPETDEGIRELYKIRRGVGKRK